jgi:YfiH family protein
MVHNFFDKRILINSVVFNKAQCVRVKQTHSIKCVTVTKPLDNWVEADAIVTTIPNVPIGIITADCAPILIRAINANGQEVIGAAHAGWQGALNGIIENTVKKMDCVMKTVQAWIGPCISKESYEVSKGYEKPFVAKDSKSGEFFTEKNKEKLLFDLKGYCAWRLQQCGIHNIEISNIDTLTDDCYHSHRGGAKSSERNLSAIMIEG